MRAISMFTACAVVLMGCGPKEATPAADSAGADSMGANASMSASGGAKAIVTNALGHELGSLTLSDGTGGITVSGTLRGLSPGDHGIHIHMTGACEAPAFTTAGGHWNPMAKMHGSQNPEGPHFGDMMNITAGADSTAAVQLTTTGGSLFATDMLMDADGAAIVVHATADDYKTDPSGNSGDRVGCGVIGRSI